MTLPDWIIERIRLGEVPDEWRDRVAAAAGTPEVQAALAELERSDREILAAYPPAAVAAKIAPAPSRSRLASWFLAGPIVAVAALVLWIGVGRSGSTTGELGHGSVGEEGVRFKGGPALAIYRAGEGGAGQAGEREPELLVHGSSVAAGDRLQLGYRSAGAGFGVILSLDGRGAVTVHWPEAAGARNAAPLEATASLPFSYELDDAPAFERFVFVTAAESFALAPVVAAAESVARGADADATPLELEPDLAQSSVTLLKERAH